MSGKYQRRYVGTPVETHELKQAAKQGWSESWGTYANERTWQVIDTLLGMPQNAKDPGASGVQLVIAKASGYCTDLRRVRRWTIWRITLGQRAGP